jgi:hypothetical protein
VVKKLRVKSYPGEEARGEESAAVELLNKQEHQLTIITIFNSSAWISSVLMRIRISPKMFGQSNLLKNIYWYR